jgi:nicotinamide-nucleotide amidase
VKIELINTGSELMLGRILNTHQQWICREMADLGYVVSRQVSVPDTGTAIEEAVREALGRSDLIITTGGLGPTSDDITRDLIAQLLGRELVEDGPAIENIENFFRIRKGPMPERARVQAMVPQGAIVLQNSHGLAPGVAMGIKPNPFRPAAGGSWLIMLPGPPRELRPMFKESVQPLLRRILPDAKLFFSRTLRTVGIGESAIQEKIAGPLSRLVEAGLEVGYCASTGQVDVRVATQGGAGENILAEAEQIVRAELGSHIFGAEDDTLESVIVQLLTKRGETLALAESCTGGYISNRLTNVPGTSAVLLAGLITYSNAAKEKFLGARAETLAQHGAVSEAVALEMAEGARRETRADYSISVTGIAGPGGGTPDKPVGTVFIGLATPAKTFVRKHYNPYDRETFKQVTAQQAMDLLRRKISNCFP